jgi:hypothetical protein
MTYIVTSGARRASTKIKTMRIRLLFTLGLVLLLSTLASSNECARYGKKCDGCKNLAVPVAKQAQASSEYSTLIINKLLYI